LLFLVVVLDYAAAPLRRSSDLCAVL